MISRATSFSGKLRRTKSVSSVKSRRQAPSITEPFDTKTAQLHALTAASLAMQRATDRLSTDTAVSDNQANSDGPLSFQAQPSAYSRECDNTSCYKSQPETPASADGKSNKEQSNENSGIPINFEEFGLVAEDTVPSLPSSYRKLRKSKSMFSTQRRSFRDPSNSGRSLRRSMSFFKTEKEPTARLNHSTDDSEAAIQLAREQYIDLEHRRAANTSESTIRKSRQEPKPFRKTVRSMSNKTCENNTATDTSDNISPRNDRRGFKSRLFSQSIKNRLRRMFGRVSGNSGQIPVEQVDVSQLNFGDLGRSVSGMDQSSPQSYHNGMNQGSKIGRPASVRSVKSYSSIGTSGSRISSWTDSTAANTIRQPPTNQGQLTIIQEDGDPIQYTPTPSPLHHNHHDGYSVFRQPLQLDGTESGTGRAVDSQRVYSALLREIDGPGREAKQAGSKRGIGSVRGVSSPNPSRRTTRSSIRQVPSEASMNYSTPASMIPKGSPGAQSQFSTKSSGTIRLTPQQVAHYNENFGRDLTRQSLRGSKSSVFSTCSEIRPRIVHEALPPRESSFCAFDDAGSVITQRSTHNVTPPESPSVYSRTTSGKTPPQSQSDSESEDERGTATILTSHILPYRPRKAENISNTQQPVRVSSEWKTWMNSQMDLIESSAQSHSLNNATNIHYREDAQIHDDDVDTETQKQPIQVDELKPNHRLVSGMQEQRAQDLAEDRLPLAELRSLSRSNFSRPLRNSPNGTISICNTVAQKPSVAVADVSQPCTPVISNSNMRSSSSIGSIRTRSVSRTPTASSPLVYNKSRPSDSEIKTSPSRRDSSTARSSASIRNRYGNRNSPGSPLYTSDNRQHLQAVQFNSMRPKRDKAELTKENRKTGDTQPPRRHDSTDYASKLDDIHSTISSKRMVDLFISDRRREMRGSEDGVPAFL